MANEADISVLLSELNNIQPTARASSEGLQIWDWDELSATAKTQLGTLTSGRHLILGGIARIPHHATESEYFFHLAKDTILLVLQASVGSKLRTKDNLIGEMAPRAIFKLEAKVQYFISRGTDIAFCRERGI